MEKEIWKNIKGYNNKYQVSNLGRIKSLNGTPKILKPYKIRKYLGVKLMNNHKAKNVYIHRLVLDTFKPNSTIKEQVNHINGNKYDNRLSNLEWCTQIENIKHAINNGLNKPTIEKRRKKVAQLTKAGNLIKIWNSQTEAAKFYNINSNYISCCCNGKRKTTGGYRWKNVE